ncbi:MAG TPA: error-prone DNA polymerase [Candidatus Dormibacteraeota bacterium]|nr:error-prone DNA polymerase [Candidatus Dormibacteraeota bacterium]
MTPYVELHSHSNYSFLDGGSHPYELAMRAAELEMPALAITDTGGVYGAVRHLQACRKLGIKPIIGSALEVDGEELILIARNLGGYSNLCRLLSISHADQPKGEARTKLATIAEHRGDLFYLSATDSERRLRDLQDALGRENVFSELHHHLRPEDEWVLEGRAAMARRCGAGVVATNQVHYHVAARRRLHDVLVAVRHRATLDEASPHLFPNSEHRLKGGDELRPLFNSHAEAVATPWQIAQHCDVDLDFRKVRFPGYPVPAGETPFSFLYKLCFEGLRERYRPITSTVTRRLQQELEVIEKTGLAEFFLINWDLMRFAREHGVPGQGRGSAADSIVAYVLGITRVDPIEHNLLFERFLHEEMTSTPDIDIDFSTEHREQVIQYIYEKYGWERTGMVCNVVTFQPRMAIRQVGKALGFSAELLDRLAKGVDRWFTEDVEDSMTGAVPPPDLRPQSWQQFLDLCREVIDFPRHLSIHNGGMLVTGEPLVDIAPVEPATMEGRRVVQFNKDDVEDLGLIKMDMLGLRTLSVVAEALELIKDTTGVTPDLDRLPLNDPAVFEMCSEADTIGVFQIESRAQMQTLPRTRPKTFNDLVVEVAIIRPGPIQGNAVHPYIRRKQGREPVTYAHPLLEPILKDTLGVILYQEQIIEIAMYVAGMKPGRADGFRRAMTRHLNRVEMSSLEDEFIDGCLGNDVPREVADQLFTAVRGFAEYGFCRSHAAAFARTAYETAWMKLNHPVEFGCGLLNNQPMGFYHPSVLVEDLKRHGLTALPVDINRSDVRCLPESVPAGDELPARAGTSGYSGVFAPPKETNLAEGPPSSVAALPRLPTESSLLSASTQPVKTRLALRIGFNYVRDLGEDGRKAIVANRISGGPYLSFDDFLARLRGGPIGPRAVRNLVMVGAFDALGRPRRELLWGWQERWHGKGLRRGIDKQSELILNTTAPDLPHVDEFDANQLEYRISDLSTGHHLIHFCRDRLRELGAMESNKLPSIGNNKQVRVAGLVITRQAPSTANRIRFFTLEDEFGQVNVTIKSEVYDRYRLVANRQPILIIDGVMQRQDGVHSVLASHIEALTGVPRPAQRSHDYR